MVLDSPLPRRAVLGFAKGLVAVVAAAALGARRAFAAWNKPAFEAKALTDALKGLGVEKATPSAEVQLIASEIAENGAVVPVQAVSKLPNTTEIAFLVEKNPNTLAAIFEIGPDMLAEVSTRLKLGQTSNVIALVKADGQYFTASKEIKVTLGGCGG